MRRAAKEVIGVYRRHARAWTQARGSWMPERTWIDRFAALLEPHAHVLDIGCGSGEPIARYLSELGYSVTGVDSSPEMIEMFTDKLPNQEVMVGDMRALKLGKRFGGLLAWDSFFDLPHDDQRAMFAQFRNHALMKAPLMFTSGPKHGQVVGTLEGDPLFHASLAPSEYVSLLAGSGFNVIGHVAEDPTCGGRTVWLAQRCK